MPVNVELSRRQLLKAAAGGAALAFVPFLGEKGRTAAQEATPQQTPETHIEIPKFETLQDQIHGFTALVTENMKPDALTSLGLTPLLTEEALKKLHDSGDFITVKENPVPENPDAVFLECSLKTPNAKYSFSAWYVYEDTKRDGLWENIVFVSDAKQGLRQNGDDVSVAYDNLQSNAEFFFNLPADEMSWKDLSEFAPETEKDKYKGLGIIGEWQKDTPLTEKILLQLEVNGFIGYTHFKGEPKTTQGSQNSQQRMAKDLAVAIQCLQKWNLKEPKFDKLGSFNIPQV